MTIEDIRQRRDALRSIDDVPTALVAAWYFDDIPTLLAEVERLRVYEQGLRVLYPSVTDLDAAIRGLLAENLLALSTPNPTEP